MIPRTAPKIVARAVELIRATTPHKKTILRVMLAPILQREHQSESCCSDSAGVLCKDAAMLAAICTPFGDLAGSGSAHPNHGQRFHKHLCRGWLKRKRGRATLRIAGGEAGLKKKAI